MRGCTCWTLPRLYEGRNAFVLAESAEMDRWTGAGLEQKQVVCGVHHHCVEHFVEIRDDQAEQEHGSVFAAHVQS